MLYNSFDLRYLYCNIHHHVGTKRTLYNSLPAWVGVDRLAQGGVHTCFLHLF